jgi:mannose-6-phosphate isomerase
MYRIALLKNPIQEYAWGSRTFIHELLGKASPGRKPLAEMWMGVHRNGPSLVSCDRHWMPLAEFIDKDPKKALGSWVARSFSNKLPFLFKVLAAAKPLSIQAHPNRIQALEGFRREEVRGIDLNAPERNYKDHNHKPEIFCALSPVFMLKGFRKREECHALIERFDTPHLSAPLRRLLEKDKGEALKPFFSALLGLSKEKQVRAVLEVVKFIKSHALGDLTFTWVINLSRAFPDDVMTLSPLFLNLIRLEPGEAIQISPGTLHVYLQGAGVELMANSDNVLRAGLTNKHTDFNELLKVANFYHESSKILRPERKRKGEWVYPSDADEFSLSMISPGKDCSYTSPKRRSLEIMICAAGRSKITDLRTGDALSMNRGVSVVVPATVEQYRIQGNATIYKASVPIRRTWYPE